jgi:GT2 family glycosyltransferase
VPRDESGLLSTTGVVVIGRNEGSRLQNCFCSGVREAPYIVYVDSGSTDGSVELAKSLGMPTVELDPTTAFSAARARNEGFRLLLQIHPRLEFVQFVDGDCELDKGWLETGAEFLRDHENVAVVAGHLHEKFPDKSIYNRLCDIEWDVPIGEAKDCGGIAMMRAKALDGVHGFRTDLIAGEEPELCVRMRQQGWHIWRLAEAMAQHDAAMTRFGQWWVRTQRAGHAIAQGATLHGESPERFGIREVRSILVWGLAIPLSAVGLTAFFGWPGLLLLTLYPLQIVRLSLRGSRSTRENWLNATFLIVGKLPAMLGLIQFYVRRGMGRESRLMEYK